MPVMQFGLTRSPIIPLEKQGCFILPEKWQGEQRKRPGAEGAEGDFSE